MNSETIVSFAVVLNRPDFFSYDHGTSLCFCSENSKKDKCARYYLAGGGGAFECNFTGRCPFFKNLHNPFRKKICSSIPCFGIIRFQKQ